MNKYVSLIAFLVIAVAAASGGSVFKPGPWYEGLAKPDWTPPNWLFAGVLNLAVWQMNPV